MLSVLCGLLASELRFSWFCGKALYQLNSLPVSSFTFFKVGIRRVKMPACLVLSSMDAEAQRQSELGYVGLVELVEWP